MKPFDLTPDPKVLIALTHTPMQPLDALCELIDNSIDSFQVAELQGQPIQAPPLVVLDIPRKVQVAQENGSIRVRDNGTGMSPEMAEKALRAGFSGNNPYDSLGLFGMGFNISTGKMGRTTRFLTARREDTFAIEVIIDLEIIKAAKSYSVPVNEVPKPPNFDQGTLVEVSKWWPEGNPNKGFILKLSQYGTPRIRQELGRRYSTLLRGKKVQIVVNGEPVEPFEHCIWDDTRFVERRVLGKIPAVFRFDEVVGVQRRCTTCTALVEPGLTACQSCGSAGMRTLEERIRGWVGIQRFDDPVNYGIDLIRNGRAIRISEKSAFFEFTDEFKHTIKDYPIDSPYGRIVGEVHLNHCPVDFLKQDFQRSTPEWQRAMTFLRGDSSLQPNQPGADKNESPVFKLYQGYRRVRNAGKSDMYMGFWDNSSNAPRRISREIEKEFVEKFVNRLAGYYEDTEWWKMVEQADKRPLEELVECPQCQSQNLSGNDVCQVCGYVLIGKECLNNECKKTIPSTAVSCPVCGTPQILEIAHPWTCAICDIKNSPELTSCKKCGEIRGALHPLSKEFLLKNSQRVDDLSIEVCTVELSDGSISTPLKVISYATAKPISPPVSPPGVAKQIPIVTFKNPPVMEIFLDLGHRIFTSFDIRPEQMIAAEIALFIFESNRSLVKYQGTHSISSIQVDIIQNRWAGVLEQETTKVQTEVAVFIQSLKNELPAILKDVASDVFDELGDESKRNLVDNLLDQHRDLSELDSLRKSGEFLRYVDNESIILIFKQYAERFFDGVFWSEAYQVAPGLSADMMSKTQQRVKFSYLNCLEDICNFQCLKNPDRDITIRARASLACLQRRLA